MNYLINFKGDFLEFACRFIVLLVLIQVVVECKIGEITTNKNNYSNNEKVEISCQYNEEPKNETTDYFILRLKPKYKDILKTPIIEIVRYNNDSYVKENKTFKIVKNHLEIGYYEIECNIFTDMESGIDSKPIHVGTKPEPVQNFTCINYAFDKLVCSFDTPYNPVAVNHSVEVMTGNQNKKCCTLISEKNHHNCTTDISETDTSYKFIVKSENSLSAGEPLSETFDVNLLNVTVPPRVDLNLNSKLLTTSSAAFDFDLVNSAYYESNPTNRLYFNITLQSEKGIHKNLNFSVSNKIGNLFVLKLEDLPHPNWTYNLTFRSKMQLTPNNTKMYFSAPSYYTFTTRATKPYRPPPTNIGAFEVLQSNVTIFWESLDDSEYNGPNFRYDIQVYQNGRLSNLKPLVMTLSSATYSINSRTDIDYKFEIFSKNDLGSSKSSVIKVNRNAIQRKAPIEDVWKVTNDREANLTWSLNGVENDFTSFTVFWCKGKHNNDYRSCDGSIYFEEIPNSESSHVFESIKSDKDNYGISMNFPDYSTGIVWNSCSAREDKTLEQVKNFRIEKTLQKREVVLRWSVDCQLKSIASGYDLKYCLLDSVTDDCIGQMENKTLNRKLESYTIKLKPYSRYRFSIAMFKESIDDIQDEYYSHATIETNQDAPSPPQNLEAFNVTSTSVFLKWKEPEEMNGIFKGYTVYINGTPYPNKTNSTHIKLTPLEGHKKYNVYVVASTIEESEPSNTKKIETLIGNPSEPMSPFYSYLSESASWVKPQHPNGNVEFYEVTMGDRASLVDGLSCKLKDCYKSQGKKFKVVAVNAVKDYPRDNLSSNRFTMSSSIYSNSLCEEDNSTFIQETFKDFIFFESNPSFITMECSPGPPWMLWFGILISCIVVPFLLAISIYKVNKMRKIKLILPPGLGFETNPIKNNDSSIQHEETESEQTMETTENECSTLTGKEYNFDFEEIITDKPKPPLFLTNNTPPVIDTFTKRDCGSGYIKIKPESGYIQNIQPNTGGGYIKYPELQKIKNDSEYLRIETEESMPAPLMSGYVAPGSNFFK